MGEHAVVAAPASEDADEVLSVARELARGYATLVESHRRAWGITPADADAKARDVGDGAWLDRYLTDPPDQLSWWNLSALVERDPDQGYAAWERVKHEARKELATGHRAARALEWDGSPWERARFLALREAFRAEWRPRGGLEATLVDTLAQAHSTYLFWLERLHVQATGEAKVEDHKLRTEDGWQPPRLGTAAAMEQSAAMADRFNRLFLRTLRALRDLRRYAGPVIVQQAGQVNVGGGGQQVNVASSVRAPDTSEIS